AAVFELARAARQAVEAYELTGIARVRREAAERQLAARREEFEARVGRMDLLLQAQLAGADATAEAATAWAGYALAPARPERRAAPRPRPPVPQRHPLRPPRGHPLAVPARRAGLGLGQHLLAALRRVDRGRRLGGGPRRPRHGAGRGRPAQPRARRRR